MILWIKSFVGKLHLIGDTKAKTQLLGEYQQDNFLDNLKDGKGPNIVVDSDDEVARDIEFLSEDSGAFDGASSPCKMDDLKHNQFAGEVVPSLNCLHDEETPHTHSNIVGKRDSFASSGSHSHNEHQIADNNKTIHEEPIPKRKYDVYRSTKGLGLDGLNSPESANVGTNFQMETGVTPTSTTGACIGDSSIPSSTSTSGRKSMVVVQATSLGENLRARTLLSDVDAEDDKEGDELGSNFGNKEVDEEKLACPKTLKLKSFLKGNQLGLQVQEDLKIDLKWWSLKVPSFDRVDSQHDEVAFTNDEAFMVEYRHWSLTQKYGIKTFKELVGKNLVAQALSNTIVRGKIGLAYVFYGPYGIGKNLMCKNICSNTKLSYSGAE
eukprot:Gb_04679 [translate_table: standard]